MIQKLKDLLDSIKGILLWVVLPILGLFGYIYYLLQSKSTLKEKLAEKTADEVELKQDMTLQKVQEELDAITKQSTDSVAEFERLRDAYVRQGEDTGEGSDSSGGKGDNGPAEGH